MSFIKKVMLAVFCITLVICSLKFPDINDSIPTSAKPDSKPTIVIDAGHGGFDGGAVALDGTTEKDINLSIALKLKQLLMFGGYDVIMIRETDDSIESNPNESISNRKVSDMKNRLRILNSNSSLIFISIHQNKFSTSSANGAQVFYSDNREESRELALSVQNSFENRLKQSNQRAIKKADKNIYLLYNAKNPAIIVECGFLSNTSELSLLKSDEYQKKIAFTIYSGFLDFIA